MKKNLTWLDKEINKDKNEVSAHKIKIIREILNVSKEDITKGPLKMKKDNLWKRMLNKMKVFFKR